MKGYGRCGRNRRAMRYGPYGEVGRAGTDSGTGALTPGYGVPGPLEAGQERLNTVAEGN